MSILKIATIPDPVLKTPSRRIDAITTEIIKLAADLSQTMRCHKNCIGLAAPQVRKNVRMITLDVSLYPKPHKNHGFIILLNPVIVCGEEKLPGREGCLSVPDFTANVFRNCRVAVEGFDIKGKPHKIDSEGFEAVVLQHEIDHLDGILFLDRVVSLKTDVFRRKQSC